MASIGAPRVLLRKLREIMADQAEPQLVLDKIVALIAANMVAEVSSIYLVRENRELELFATEGLNPESVHLTRMAPKEGLVGLIAESADIVNLPDAQSHPAFSLHPETGEQPFHSFLGVPILRGGHALGVVTVQNKVSRSYSEEEVEALQTTAMVLAEMIARGDFDLGSNDEQSFKLERSLSFAGSSLSDGVALGHAVLHEPRVIVTNLIAEQTEVEFERLENAIDELRLTVDEMLDHRDMTRAGEHRDILEAYRMFAYDRGWFNRLKEAVSTGLTAEAAVERVQNDTRARMLRQTDPYIRERLHDLDDLSNRLLRLLTGQTSTSASEELAADTILFARNMGPAELLDYDREILRALVLEEGSSNSHVAIVARALGIAAVGGVEDILQFVDSEDAVVVDAEVGEVFVRPSQEVVDAYAEKVRFRAKKQEKFAALRDTPAVTKDNQSVKLLMNAGLLVDLPHLHESGAEGVGLFRTELQFMIAETFPRLDEQTEIYRTIFESAGDKPVIFRSLDIGGDKVLPYFRHAQEENPALGWRAIRMSLDRPGLFRSQIRALLRASAGRDLSIMLPMISEVREFKLARSFVDREIAHLQRHGRSGPDQIKLGAMIEVPSILWQLDALLTEVDFLSVGSNDLMQFMFASDRSNRRVSHRFDSLSATFLRVLAEISAKSKSHKVPLTLCGEMASRPLEAMALVGLGYRSISMEPAAIGPVKEMVLSLNSNEIEVRIQELIACETESIREKLEEFASKHQVNV